MPFSKERAVVAKTSHDRAGKPRAQVLDAKAESLPPVRPGASYIRLVGLCRICFRQHALKGQLPGIKKSSW